ncbi:SpoIIE family protein phosphatase [Kineococcus sp. GCM10028916]|uniref:ATP-binding SpoIIE family protein phosphatase n=1 Tax=Kineococcus sp. GCM10028916 TaxID=3273394 RepID=UPI00363A8647
MARLGLVLSVASTVEQVVTSLIDLGVPALSAAGLGIITRAQDGGWQLGASTSFGSVLRARFDYEPYDSPLPACRAAREDVDFFLPDRASAVEVHPRMAEVVDLTGRPRWALLPLRVGAEVVGALAVSWTSPAPFTEDEETALRIFAAHCAPSVERVLAGEVQRRSNRETEQLATVLQRGVVTRLPTLDGLELAVSYRPCADGAAIGGDWYDVFARRNGDVVVVVGDVAGHDQVAASTMIQLRAMLRGIAWDSDDGPAPLLDRLDRSTAALEPGTTATAVLLTLTRRADAGFDVRWASAGHPPLLLRRPDGVVEVLGGHDDPLLGVDWPSPRRGHRRLLSPGTTLVAVTDGALETRDHTLAVGVDHLAAALGTAADVGAGPGTVAERTRDHLEGSTTSPRPPGGPEPRDGSFDPVDDRTVLVVRALPTAVVPGSSGDGDTSRAGDSGVDGGRTSRVVLLRPEAASAPVARALVRSLATTGGWGEDDVDTAELLVSELVANAVIHGRSDLRLTASTTAHRLLVEVEDGNERMPVLLPDDAAALSGRGLHLVQNASDEWGCRPVEGHGAAGKVVWFALDRGTR